MIKWSCANLQSFAHINREFDYVQVQNRRDRRQLSNHNDDLFIRNVDAHYPYDAIRVLRCVDGSEQLVLYHAKGLTAFDVRFTWSPNVMDVGFQLLRVLRIWNVSGIRLPGWS
jgi:hypothetical protein